MLLLAKSSDVLAGISATALILIILSAIIGIVFLVADVYSWLLIARYRKLNRKNASINETTEQLAQKLLEKEGITDVSVKKCGLFRSLLYGNSYSRRKKTVFLRKNIYGKSSLTGVATATRLVGLAVQDRDKDKRFLFVSAALPYVQFAPFMVLPLVILGLILDLVVFSSAVPFLITLILLGVSLVYVIIAFVFTLLNVKVNKTAIIVAKDLIENGELGLTEDEKTQITKLHKIYLTKYVLDFITGTLELVKLLLQIIYTILKGLGKIKK